ncbi:MAG: NAD(P)-dependent oxidoreductase [Desulfobacterales bacterium]|nr:NAD(P)-dependent oxidoreductase [Desulfobacterales bacterium]
MSNPRVFVFAPTGGGTREIEEAGCTLVFGSASWLTPQGNSEDEMCIMARDADALTGASIRSSPITGKVMESAPNLRIIAKSTVGVDDVDIEAATDRGILVTHAPTEATYIGVAEGTMGIMLTLLKKTREKDDAVKRGQWRDRALQCVSLGKRRDGHSGITVGIVGLGRIGCRFAQLLAPWRVRILACDPYVEASRFILNDVEQVDLDTLLKESDVVSLHVVLTRETRHMIGAGQLALMKQDAVLVNTSRGAVVDEKALVEALRMGRISAGLDVFEDEPLAPDSPLLKMGHRVLLSPHMVSASADTGELRPGGEWSNRAVLTALKGEVPDYVYNKEVIPRWRERFGGHRVIFTTS